MGQAQKIHYERPNATTNLSNVARLLQSNQSELSARRQEAVSPDVQTYLADLKDSPTACAEHCAQRHRSVRFAVHIPRRRALDA